MTARLVIYPMFDADEERILGLMERLADVMVEFHGLPRDDDADASIITLEDVADGDYLSDEWMQRLAGRARLILLPGAATDEEAVS